MKAKTPAAAKPQTPVARRRFLATAAATTAAAGTLGFPMVAKGQTTPISMRWQSTWPAKDIFHEYANDFAKKVNDMTGGELKIEVLPAGAVVPAFGLLDAVSKGTLDGGHGVLVYHYGKQNALALWGSGPAFGMDANMLLSWHKYGGGKDLLNKLYASIGANVVSYPYGPMPTQPLGWFKKPITKADDFKGLKFRTVGISIDVFTGARRGGQRAARRRDRAGDGPRPAGRGRVQQRDVGPHPRLPGRLEDLHAAELPPERRAVRDHVQQDQVRRAAGEDARDHRQRRRGRLGRHVVEGDRPLLEGLRRDAAGGHQVLQDAGRASCSGSSSVYDTAAAKKSEGNALFKEIEASQKAFAARAVKWDLDTNVQRRHGVQPLLREGCRPREEGLTRSPPDSHPARAGWLFLFRARFTDAPPCNAC